MTPNEQNLNDSRSESRPIRNSNVSGDLFAQTGNSGSLIRTMNGPTNYHPEDYDATASRALHHPFSRGHYAGKGPRAFQKSDERLHEVVCDLLTEAPDVDPSDVEVAVKSGVVTLTGSVPTARMKRILIDTVETVRGVLDVHNHLEVRSLRS